MEQQIREYAYFLWLDAWSEYNSSPTHLPYKFPDADYFWHAAENLLQNPGSHK